MVDLPSPIDVLSNTLIWLGVPALLLLPLSVALWLADWFRTVRGVGAGAGKLAKRTRDVFGRARSQQRFLLVEVIVLQGAVVALVYACFRLAYAMTVADEAGRNIADGKSFTWSELWMNLTEYSTANSLSLQAFWVACGWVAAVNVALFLRSQLLTNLLTLPLAPVIWLLVLAAVGIGVVGLMVLSLATWMNAPGYNLGMVSLYAFWVILLGGLAVAAPTCLSSAKRLYKA